jgi:uncharacterized protein (DUF3084 family)
MRPAAHEEAQRILRRLEQEAAAAHQEYEDLAMRYAVMRRGGYLASARGLAVRVNQARDAMERARTALRNFQQGRT